MLQIKSSTGAGEQEIKVFPHLFKMLASRLLYVIHRLRSRVKSHVAVCKQWSEEKSILITKQGKQFFSDPRY